MSISAPSVGCIFYLLMNLRKVKGPFKEATVAVIVSPEKGA